MGKLSVDSIPLRYSAYFILAQDLKKSIDYFTDASGERRQRSWFQLNYSGSSLFKAPDVIIQKKWTPLPVETKTEPVEKPLPEWAGQGGRSTCLPPLCWGIR